MATKLALEGFSDCLRMEATPFGIDVVVVEPGAIRTEWGAISRDSLLARSVSTVTPNGLGDMLDQALSARLSSEPEVIARAIEQALTSRRPKTRYAVCGGANSILAIRRLISDRRFDRLMWASSQAVRNNRFDELPLDASEGIVDPGLS